MSTAATPVTAEKLAALSADGRRRELVEGELRMMSPAGSEHGRVAMRLGSLLEQHVRANKLGAVFAAETGFQLSKNPDTVRAPDVAFVRAEMVKQFEGFQGFLPLAPDLVAEVVSPNDSFSQVEKKTGAWLSAGVQMVLIVDPGRRTIQVFRDPTESIVLSNSDQLDASDVVDDWRLTVSELFD
ncbi:MAG: Uma2 family endonuclease [Planctomycetes bacterium]|nr:Uma2 family endonuclease [Planctomycetota bacterium]